MVEVNDDEEGTTAVVGTSFFCGTSIDSILVSFLGAGGCKTLETCMSC